MHSKHFGLRLLRFFSVHGIPLAKNPTRGSKSLLRAGTFGKQNHWWIDSTVTTPALEPAGNMRTCCGPCDWPEEAGGNTGGKCFHHSHFRVDRKESDAMNIRAIRLNRSKAKTSLGLWIQWNQLIVTFEKLRYVDHIRSVFANRFDIKRSSVGSTLNARTAWIWGMVLFRPRTCIDV